MSNYLNSMHIREGHMASWTKKFGDNEEMNPWSMSRLEQTRKYFDPLPEPDFKPPRFVLLTWDGAPENFGSNSWSPGSRKKNIEAGDRVLLLRQGLELGFVALGVVTGSPRLSGELREAGGYMTLVGVDWDIAASAPIIRPENLPPPVRAVINFHAQGGGEDLKSVGLFVDQEFRRRYYDDIDEPISMAHSQGDIGDTEAQVSAKRRRGQSKFRAGVELLSEHRCLLTGVTSPDLLRASHIKPWASCDSKAERLDPHNGFLLTPTADHLFDGGHITFDDDGTVRFARYLDQDILISLGGEWKRCLRPLTSRQKQYLAYHRDKVFEKKLKNV